jgi:succinate dehydrogenase / fumarate reductase flavoprotein subunit
VKRSHSVCAQGGINSVNSLTRQQGDNEWKHFDDTVYGGDFLQHQPPVKEMADWGPRIVDLMDRLGVPFNRTPEGFRDQRRFGGTLYKRTAFAGATTGQQLLYSLDEQVRRWEVEGRVKKWEFWDFLEPVLDDSGRCRGAICQDLVTMQFRAFPADAVVLATGGCGLIYGRSTMSMVCSGSAVSRAYRAGAAYGNGEFIQVHPTAIPGADKLRLMSESARGEGGRVWVPRKPHDPRDPREIPEAERMYFLEERYPKYGNLVPRDIATREIFDVCTNEGLSVEKDRLCVYLDLTHVPRETLDRKLGGILEIYEKFQGVDPRVVPMKIFPAVHYSMGGLWTTYTKGSYNPTTALPKHKSGSPAPIDAKVGMGMQLGAPNNSMTNIPGLYAFGEVNFAYHGANRLGANALLSCIFDGLFCGVSVFNYVKNEAPGKAPAEGLASGAFDESVSRETARMKSLVDAASAGASDPATNPYAIGKELGDEMTAACTVVRTETRAKQCLTKIAELKDRYAKVKLSDSAGWTNQSFSYARAVGDMLAVAEAIALGSLERRESRGAHYRSDYPDRNDAEFMKTSLAKHEGGKTTLEFVPIDASLVAPTARTYGKKDTKKPEMAGATS